MIFRQSLQECPRNRARQSSYEVWDPSAIRTSDMTVLEMNSLSTRTPSQSKITSFEDKLFSLKFILDEYIVIRVYESDIFDVNGNCVLSYFVMLKTLRD